MLPRDVFVEQYTQCGLGLATIAARFGVSRYAAVTQLAAEYGVALRPAHRSRTVVAVQYPATTPTALARKSVLCLPSR
jgi:hypothetical protein